MMEWFDILFLFRAINTVAQMLENKKKYGNAIQLQAE